MPVTLKTNSFKYRDSSEDEWSPAIVQAVAPLDPAMNRIDEIEDSLALLTPTMSNIMSNAVTISNVNLNNYTTNGIYLTDGNLTNSPSGNYGLLFVIMKYDYIGWQFYFPQGDDELYFRRYYNNAWLTWKKLQIT